MNAPIRDPVCGVALDSTSSHKQSADGREYFFCSDACQRKFQENPGAYARKEIS